MYSPTITLAQKLVQQPSITPKDEGCQILLCERLKAIGFEITNLDSGEDEQHVKNFWAIRSGGTGPTLGFAGHTDVVPTGPIESWTHDPFDATIVNNMLYGRGAADMKGSLAAMIVACEEFISIYPQYPGSIAFLITSDEEGPAIHGTIKIVDWLRKHNIPLEYCIVGEPTSKLDVGDMIKNGRRGSLNASLKIIGQQGHIAYPHLAQNPIHKSLAALDKLTSISWDQGNQFFQPTSLQISNISSGTGATNVIPGTLECLFNFRYSTEVTASELQRKVEDVLNEHHLEYEINWTLSGEPFLTPQGKLLEAAVKSIQYVTNIKTEISTSGGTSDGRFIAQLGTQIIECGPSNKTIHQINESVDVTSLETLKDIYKQCLKNIFIEG
jgi:succinyl-diaminopimelate desuccinylase